jgi:hypothetical protein
LRKRRAGLKILRHLKILQFVFKLNYIVKVNLFLNIESAFKVVKQQQKMALALQAFTIIKMAYQNLERALKAKGFFAIKMLKRSNKFSLIPFLVIMKKILNRKIINIKHI